MLRKSLLIFFLFLIIPLSTTNAGDIKVPASTWEPLPEEDKAKIQEMLTETKLLEIGDKIVPVSDVPGTALEWNPIKDICKSVCDATAAAAAAACSGSTVAIAACIVAVNAAREECRRRC